MNNDTAGKAGKKTPTSVVERLARTLSHAIEAHTERTRRLRVYPATRRDGRKTSTRPVQRDATAPGLQAPAPGVIRRCLRRIGNGYAAHEARLVQLRVYDPRL